MSDCAPETYPTIPRSTQAVPSTHTELTSPSDIDPLDALGEGYLKHWQAAELVNRNVTTRFKAMLAEIREEYFGEPRAHNAPREADYETAVRTCNPANQIISSIHNIGSAPKEGITILDRGGGSKDLISTGVKGNPLSTPASLDTSRYRQVIVDLLCAFPKKAAKHGLSPQQMHDSQTPTQASLPSESAAIDPSAQQSGSKSYVAMIEAESDRGAGFRR